MLEVEEPAARRRAGILRLGPGGRRRGPGEQEQNGDSKAGASRSRETRHGLPPALLGRRGGRRFRTGLEVCGDNPGRETATERQLPMNAARSGESEAPRGRLTIRRSAIALRRNEEGESPRTIVIALLANVVIGVAKLLAGLASGSSAMIAEAAHSAADCVNEVFLAIGLYRARQPPDDDHPFGHARERFLWAFMAAIASFLVGGCVSIGIAIRELETRAPGRRRHRAVDRSRGRLRGGRNVVAAGHAAGAAAGEGLRPHGVALPRPRERSRGARRARRGQRRADRSRLRRGRPAREPDHRLERPGLRRVAAHRRAARGHGVLPGPSVRGFPGRPVDRRLRSSRGCARSSRGTRRSRRSSCSRRCTSGPEEVVVLAKARPSPKLGHRGARPRDGRARPEDPAGAPVRRGRRRSWPYDGLEVSRRSQRGRRRFDGRSRIQRDEVHACAIAFLSRSHPPLSRRGPSGLGARRRPARRAEAADAGARRRGRVGQGGGVGQVPGPRSAVHRRERHGRDEEGDGRAAEAACRKAFRARSR